MLKEDEHQKTWPILNCFSLILILEFHNDIPADIHLTNVSDKSKLKYLLSYWELDENFNATLLSAQNSKYEAIIRLA